jgi:N-acetylglucosamine kinase-like BadF-type ATPase
VREILGQVVSTPIEVVGDMEIALEAAFGSEPGVIVIAGTGSIAYGRDRQGKTLRAGGWGFAIGDEGSAHWIGRAAVAAVLRASDRKEDAARSRLAQGLSQIWKVNSLSDLARAANSVPPPDFSALFPAVTTSQDELAKEVLLKAGRELAEVAAVVIDRLFQDLQMGSVPVGMVGGVFRHAAVVREVFYNELRRLAPRAEIDPRVVEPVEGALRMARRG